MMPVKVLSDFKMKQGDNIVIVIIIIIIRFRIKGFRIIIIISINVTMMYTIIGTRTQVSVN